MCEKITAFDEVLIVEISRNVPSNLRSSWPSEVTNCYYVHVRSHILGAAADVCVCVCVCVHVCMCTVYIAAVLQAQ